MLKSLRVFFHLRVDSIVADSSVKAWVRITLVHVLLALSTSITWVTDAVVTSNPVLAPTVRTTRLAEAVVNIRLTTRACKMDERRKLFGKVNRREGGRESFVQKRTYKVILLWYLFTPNSYRFSS